MELWVDLVISAGNYYHWSSTAVAELALKCAPMCVAFCTNLAALSHCYKHGIIIAYHKQKVDSICANNAIVILTFDINTDIWPHTHGWMMAQRWAGVPMCWCTGVCCQLCVHCVGISANKIDSLCLRNPCT